VIHFDQNINVAIPKLREMENIELKHQKTHTVRRVLPEGLGEGAEALEYGAGPS